MATHFLKTVQPYFEDIWDGVKRFEFRKNDRKFKVNDVLILREFDEKKNVFPGHRIKARITYILENFEGLENGYCVLGIRVINRLKETK